MKGYIDEDPKNVGMYRDNIARIEREIAASKLQPTRILSRVGDGVSFLYREV